jgi:hypothetical protein
MQPRHQAVADTAPPNTVQLAHNRVPQHTQWPAHNLRQPHTTLTVHTRTNHCTRRPPRPAAHRLRCDRPAPSNTAPWSACHTVDPTLRVAHSGLQYIQGRGHTQHPSTKTRPRPVGDTGPRRQRRWCTAALGYTAFAPHHRAEHSQPRALRAAYTPTLRQPAPTPPVKHSDAHGLSAGRCRPRGDRPPGTPWRRRTTPPEGRPRQRHRHLHHSPAARQKNTPSPRADTRFRVPSDKCQPPASQNAARFVRWPRARLTNRCEQKATAVRRTPRRCQPGRSAAPGHTSTAHQPPHRIRLG